jgi:lysophospholipase L1-like esterase
MAAVLVAAWRDGPRIRMALRLATICACIVIAASGTPLPLWFYGIGLVLSVLAIWTSSSKATTDDLGVALSATQKLNRLRWRFFFVATLLVGWCMIAGAWEFSYRLPPRLDDEHRYGTLAVVGDSVSAGLLGPQERTWPKQFRGRYFGGVVDVSSEGATARSALRQARSLNARLGDSNAVVLIEIGGNDYFELIPPGTFAVDLDRLLTMLSRPNRQLIMLELPLRPFYNAYGSVQREQATKHGVPLVSKREFARVVFARDATLDTVHLSETGHGLFADMVWQHVGPLLGASRKQTR